MMVQKSYLNLEDKFEEQDEQTINTQTTSQTVQQPVKKKKALYERTGFWATIAGAWFTGQGVKKAVKLVYPPKVKKLFQLGISVGAIYCALHPVWTVNKTVDGVEWLLDGVKKEYTDWKNGSEVKERANQTIAQLTQTLNETKLEFQEVQKKLEYELGVKAEYETSNKQKDKKLSSTEKSITDLRSRNKFLTQKIGDLEDMLEKYQPISATAATQSTKATISSPTTRSKQYSSNNSGLERTVSNGSKNGNGSSNVYSDGKINGKANGKGADYEAERDVKNFPSRITGIPFSVQKMFQNNEYAKMLHYDKKTNKLNLYEREGDDISWLGAWSCSDGLNDGPKGRAGDRKTPEDTGRIISMAHLGDSNPLFGTDYIKVDWNQGHQGIGICGTGIPARMDSILKGEDCTNGCVITTNTNIREITRLLRSDYKKTGVVFEDSVKPLYGK